MKTLLLALISPGKSHGTREGAIRGLVGVGKEAVRKGLVEGGGAKVVAAEWESEGSGYGSSSLLLSVQVSSVRMFSSFASKPSLGCFGSASAAVRHARIIGSHQAGGICFASKAY